MKELEESRKLIMASFSQVAEEMRQASDSTKNDLKAKLSDLTSAAGAFTGDLTAVLKKAEEETRKQQELLDTAERIGRYEAVLPLLKLNTSQQVTETEALVAMWNISNIFIQWFEKQTSTSTRGEILEQLKKTLSSLNQEIQTVGN